MANNIHKSLLDAWEDYIKKIYGINALGDIQRTETKRAFYSGAFVMFNTMIELRHIDNKRDALAYIDALHNEMVKYFKEAIYTEYEYFKH